MKPFYFLFLTGLMLFGCCGVCPAQEEDWLNKPIQLSKQAMTLPELLKSIEEQTLLHFSYDAQRISSQTLVHLISKTLTVKEILSLLRDKHAIQYVKHENTIILHKTKNQSKTSATLSGVIRDKTSGETLPGALLISNNSASGTTANRYGFYSLTQPAESNALIKISYLGYLTTALSFSFSADSIADVLLEPYAVDLSTVEVIGKADEDVQSSYGSGVHSLNMVQVKSIATMGGEPDPVKALQFLPGIQTGNEGTTNLSVRGGSHDQNLFLLDEAPVYNPSHALSFFSVFNADAVQGITLYKSAIPSRYGGRLSSVVDIQMKEGNRKKRSLSGTIGTIASRLTLEGPLSKNEKISYILSGRYCYAGAVLNAGILLTGTKPTEKISFYDVNGKINYRMNDRNHFYLSAYSGHDNFYSYLFTSGYSLNWGNQTATFRWNHVFTPRLFSNTTVLYSDYNYQYNLLNNSRIYDWTSRLQEVDIKQDYDYYVSPTNHLSFGWGLEDRVINPGSILSKTTGSLVKPFILQRQNSINGYAYISHIYSPNEKVTIGTGLRYANFFVLGPLTQYTFAPNSDTPYDSTIYSGKKIVQTFHRIDPRLWITYKIKADHSLTASYDRTNQFLHLLSNSSVGMPTDMWMPSGGKIKPQFADIFVLSYQHLWPLLGVEARVATYYKALHNVLDFKDNANLTANPYVQSQLLQGWGEAYGTEFFLEKRKGKFQGSLSYTLSKASTTIDGINDGEAFPSRYDKRHNISTTFSMKWSKRFETSLNFVFTTGGAFTMPVGKFLFSGTYDVNGGGTPPNGISSPYLFTYFSSRNGYRLPDYHRLDIGLRYNSRKNEIRKWKSWWALDIYNVYQRKNPFSILADIDVVEDGKYYNVHTKMIYIFGIVPTLSYNFTF